MKEYYEVTLHKLDTKMQIRFKLKEKDTSGLGGYWDSHGILYEIYKIKNFIVLMGPMSNKPENVFDNMADLEEFIFMKTGIKLKEIPSKNLV
jgi:hypothetical protein